MQPIPCILSALFPPFLCWSKRSNRFALPFFSIFLAAQLPHNILPDLLTVKSSRSPKDFTWPVDPLHQGSFSFLQIARGCCKNAVSVSNKPPGNAEAGPDKGTYLEQKDSPNKATGLKPAYQQGYLSEQLLKNTASQPPLHTYTIIRGDKSRAQNMNFQKLSRELDNQPGLETLSPATIQC